MNINKYFNLAKNVSKLSDYNKKPIHIGAILVYKNKVIANGWNTNKTSPLQLKYNKLRELYNKEERIYKADEHLPCIHAEMKCIIDTRNINIEWNKVAIFIYREDKKGKLRNCKPCPSCQRALKDRGIKDVFYTNENGFNYITL